MNTAQDSSLHVASKVCTYSLHVQHSSYCPTEGSVVNQLSRWVLECNVFVLSCSISQNAFCHNEKGNILTSRTPPPLVLTRFLGKLISSNGAQEPSTPFFTHGHRNG